MKENSLVECIDGNFTQSPKASGDPVPKKGDINTVLTIETHYNREYITLVEYPFESLFIASKFRELQPPMEVSISDLLPESKEHAAIALEPA